MRYLVLLSPTANPTTPPPPDLFEAIMQLGAEATAAGVLLDQSGLMPSSEGALVALRHGDIHVSDGPFAESKEIVSYAMYETRTRAEAVEWTERFLRAAPRPVGRVRGRGDGAAAVRAACWCRPT